MSFRTAPYRLAAGSIARDHDWHAVYFNPYALDVIANATEQGKHVVIEYHGEPFAVTAKCSARIVADGTPCAYPAERFASALVHRADYTVAQLAAMIDGDHERSRSYLVSLVRAMANNAKKCAA